MKITSNEDKFIYELWKTTGIFPFNPIHKPEALQAVRGVLERINNDGRLSINDIITYFNPDDMEQ